MHAEYPDNLITLLGRTHDVHAVEWITELCPRSLCTGDAPPIDGDAAALLTDPVARRSSPLATLVDEAAPLWWGQVWPAATPPTADYAAAGVTDPDDLARPGLEFISGLVEASGDRPVFDYVHVPVPHGPWQLLPSGASYNGPHPATGLGYGSPGWGPNDAGRQLAQVAKTRHLLQLQWTDRMLGTIFDRLEALGRWDDALVVVTADHGISFEPGLLRRLTPENEGDVAWAPLFIKEPGQRDPAVNDDNVLSVDVAPTVADLAGVDLDWSIDGISLVTERRADPTKLSHTVDSEPFAVQRGNDVVELETDGLTAVIGAARAGEGSDDLRPWRHGRHGDLIGRRVEDLGLCGPAPAATYEPPAGWADYAEGTEAPSGEPVPLWHEGSVAVDDLIDVAATVDGVVVGWGVARPTEEGTVFGLLLVEPLVEGRGEVPELHQVVDGDSCTLAPLRVS